MLLGDPVAAIALAETLEAGEERRAVMSEDEDVPAQGEDSLEERRKRSAAAAEMRAWETLAKRYPYLDWEWLRPGKEQS